MPLAAWPPADREGWLAAGRPGERLRRGGRAAWLKPVTRQDLERRYGYYLTHLAETGQLDHAAPAGSQVEPGPVSGFVERGRTIWRSVTLARSVRKLKNMAQILAPERDLLWLGEIANDLAFVAEPRPMLDRTLLSSELVEAGLTLVREAEFALHLRPSWRATQMRSGLMIALLALCPVRLKNLASLTLGSSLRRVGERWWIVLGRDETKGGRADERLVPEELHRAIAVYLTWARPVLMKRGAFTIGAVEAGRPDPFVSGPLWVGRHGALELQRGGAGDHGRDPVFARDRTQPARLPARGGGDGVRRGRADAAPGLGAPAAHGRPGHAGALQPGLLPQRSPGLRHHRAGSGVTTALGQALCRQRAARQSG